MQWRALTSSGDQVQAGDLKYVTLLVRGCLDMCSYWVYLSFRLVRCYRVIDHGSVLMGCNQLFDGGDLGRSSCNTFLFQLAEQGTRVGFGMSSVYRASPCY